MLLSFYIVALTVTFYDYSLTPGTKKVLSFRVFLDPFKVFQTVDETNVLKQEADSYPTIDFGDTVEIEFRHSICIMTVSS